MGSLKRREFLQLSGSLLVSGAVNAAVPSSGPLQKAIPVSGEVIPVIGMGSWITFNVGSSTAQRNIRTQVLAEFFANGGSVLDSSPMYGSSEQVLGYCLSQLGRQQDAFATTKVWTGSDAQGRRQFQDSKNFWQLPGFSAYLIHNLNNWRGHLPYLRELKQNGQIKYLGLSTSHGRRHSDVESILNSEDIDFVQLTYSAGNREVENRLLPLAKDRGVAVMVNRPFQGGRLIDRAKRTPLPAWAVSMDCDNWPQLLLKYIVSHPAVTCAIPATSQVAHMRENMGANYGRLLIESERQQIADAVRAL